MATIKQVAAYARTFLMVGSSDHITGLTGASPTVNLSMGGGHFASTNAVIAEVGNGFYQASLTSTDTRTLGDLALHFTAASADPTDITDQIVAYDPTDATRLGLSSLPTNSSMTVIVGTNNDKTGYSLSQAFPSNFSALSIAAGAGTVALNSSQTVQTGSNLDKTGYSLSQAFPSNFAALAILAGGQVGINWGNIAATASAVILSGTTINTSQSVLSGGISGTIAANITQVGGVNISGPASAGILDVNVKNYNNVVAQTDANSLPKVDVEDIKGTASAGTAGYMGPDWGNVNASTTALALTNTTINSSQSVITSAPVTVGTNNDKTGYALTVAPPTSAAITTALLTTQMTEAYAAIHTVPTLAQAVFEMRSMLSEKSVSGTSVTLFEIDGATTAETFYLDSTSPSAIHRAS